MAVKKEEDKVVSMKDIRDTLSIINVNEHTENKNGLTYLSWAWAWQIVKEHFPNSFSEVVMFPDRNNTEIMQPYFEDPDVGMIVKVIVSIEGHSIEQWLPVMDFKNNSMGRWARDIIKFWKKINIPWADMMDVNKTIQRAITKCISMFGLWAYIYAWEDLPYWEDETKETKKEVKATTKPRATKKLSVTESVSTGISPQQLTIVSTLKKVLNIETDTLIKVWWVKSVVKVEDIANLSKVDGTLFVRWLFDYVLAEHKLDNIPEDIKEMIIKYQSTKK